MHGNGSCMHNEVVEIRSLRNLTSGDLVIPLVVIQLGVTRLGKTRQGCVSPLLFEGREEKKVGAAVWFSVWSTFR